MTISIDSTRPSLTGNNTAKQSSRFSNALRSLALGAAVGLGAIAPTPGVAQEKPPENIPVQIKEEEKPPQEELSPAAKWLARILGAGTGALSYYILRPRKNSADSDSGKS